MGWGKDGSDGGRGARDPGRVGGGGSRKLRGDVPRFLSSGCCHVNGSAVTEPASPARGRNRLASSASRYLLLHADNPVDWRPWGPDAFAEAQERGVPVFLSSGYNACHWCHVMAQESFSDPALAAFLNERFVAVKVDKEERPEVDAFYMDAVVRMTGEGGWPLHAVLLPDGRPFQAALYLPPYPRFGLPSFRQWLEGALSIWDRDRDGLARTMPATVPAVGGDLTGTLDAIVAAYRFDVGGWGEGPRFPQPPRLELLLAAADRTDARRAAIHLLDTLDASGVHDHLGGGFHRYAVEEDWVVPHFEKLLVDNAQLAGVYLRAFAAFGVERYRTVARRTLGYLLDELRTERGTFAASESAVDANGEGTFYTWTAAELRAALGAERGAFASRAFGVGDWGNHEGRSVLVRKVDPSVLAAIRGPLLEARRRRPRPERDDKCVVGWNALAIDALARAGDVLSEPLLTSAALEAAERIAVLQPADGSLPRSPGGAPGILDDYAAWALACLRLHASTGAPRWLERARATGLAILARFVSGRALVEAERSAGLPADREPVLDGADPSGVGSALLALTALEGLGADGIEGIDALLDRAIARAAAEPTGAAPTLARVVANRLPTVVVSTDARLRRAALALDRGDIVVAAGPVAGFSVFEGRGDGRAYVCRGTRCLLPTNDADALVALLRGVSS
jgi:uncharacterized protein